MVLNSKGTPPASLMASLAMRPNSCRCRCPGMISMYELHTAMNGFAISSSVTPHALSRLRCGARSGPCLMVLLLICCHPILILSAIYQSILREPGHHCAQSLADFFDGMSQGFILQLAEVGLARFVLSHPFIRERPRLNVLEQA